MHNIRILQRDLESEQVDVHAGRYLIISINTLVFNKYVLKLEM